MRIHEVLEACIEYIAIDGVIGERQNALEELGRVGGSVAGSNPCSGLLLPGRVGWSGVGFEGGDGSYLLAPNRVEMERHSDRSLHGLGTRFERVAESLCRNDAAAALAVLTFA